MARSPDAVNHRNGTATRKSTRLACRTTRPYHDDPSIRPCGGRPNAALRTRDGMDDPFRACLRSGLTDRAATVRERVFPGFRRPLPDGRGTERRFSNTFSESGGSQKARFGGGAAFAPGYARAGLQPAIAAADAVTHPPRRMRADSAESAPRGAATLRLERPVDPGSWRMAELTRKVRVRRSGKARFRMASETSRVYESV